MITFATGTRLPVLPARSRSFAWNLVISPGLSDTADCLDPSESLLCLPNAPSLGCRHDNGGPDDFQTAQLSFREVRCVPVPAAVFSPLLTPIMSCPSPRHNYLYLGAELTRPCLVNINLASTHAAQRPAEAANGEEPQYANLRGYHEPIRSASFRTGANKIMTRFVRHCIR
jgi:hypothetical protein